MDILELLKATDTGVAVLVMAWCLRFVFVEWRDLVDSQQELLAKMLEKLDGVDRQ